MSIQRNRSSVEVLEGHDFANSLEISYLVLLTVPYGVNLALLRHNRLLEEAESRANLGRK